MRLAAEVNYRLLTDVQTQAFRTIHGDQCEQIGHVVSAVGQGSVCWRTYESSGSVILEHNTGNKNQVKRPKNSQRLQPSSLRPQGVCHHRKYEDQ